MKKRTIIILCLLAVASTSVAFSSSAHWKTNPFASGSSAEARMPASLKPTSNNSTMQFQPGQPNNTSAPQNTQIPEFVIYRQMFRHIAFLKDKADEKEHRGEDGSSLRFYYKRQAQLDDRKAQALDQIASECNAAVEKLDKKAKKITDDFRAQHPGGKLAQGELPPAPPAELKSLWEARTNTILQAKEHLKVAFGEQDFQRFQDYLKRGITPNIKPVKLNPSSVKMPDNMRQHQHK
jgi:hypothetical protein